jgi:acyl carrier protein
MQTTDIEQVIHAFLVENFLSGSKQRLQEEESLMGNVIDSNGVLELVMFLQERFAIRVEDDEVTSDNLDSLKRLATFVEKKLTADVSFKRPS